MKKVRSILRNGAFLLLLSGLLSQGMNAQTVKTTDTKSTKPAQTVTNPSKAGAQTKQATQKTNQSVSKSTQANPKGTKPTPAADTKKKISNPNATSIGSQMWAIANLDVKTFRNGDTIPEVKTNKEWVAAGEAGKPAWCYYNNDPVIGKKYGKLYNWFAVNDPRGLAPEGWTLPTDEDWAKLTYTLGGPNAAGIRMKSTGGWNEGNNGTNESGFNAFPAGYRVENGAFVNIGNTGIWWSTTETKTFSAFDRYVVLGGTISGSSSPKQRGESVRCLLKTGK
jgi:uncharacterized protein (TIGR02145 family)